MKAWRQAWFGSSQTPPMSQMPMVLGMGGEHGAHGGSATMNMAADVAALRNAPEPFDRAFIDAMIPHHQSAIDMARVELEQGDDEETLAMAQKVIDAQEAEIAEMDSMRQELSGGS